ncbi:hypothetical protein AVENLUH5627_03429 [Acinetobacter venetianus]|jgi:hypothetical protein|uniref:Uncharacterized protein n=1 Tax=Acinetobacter venetianus TaxID=52133 RepID=A0A150HJ91_9GAMM|nr:hypothetical protein [Acinetobacter venetianus]KXZ62707.1 hypothetical protein AVENLUH5627_03429 [Acinetobacter venetianus]
MSFYTELQIRYTQFDEIDLSTQKQNIFKILALDCIHEDIYHDLNTAFIEGKSCINVDPIYCFQLIEKIIPLFPNANIECRGLGEEYFYTWILCVENGNIIFSNKPWEKDNPYI